eukprot:TRINITY_DN73104_c0_g1_i1.p1 TRINITY_DN73104_c0_g1~~TRINITY_DN73104_c0_g1_i1.p1  ORF type:complete len:383 (-),score=56.75 TRINITY_DN73104_c0_g1_i1:240-1388(-)
MPPVKANHQLAATVPAEEHEANRCMPASNGQHASGYPQSSGAQPVSAVSSTSTPVPCPPPPRTQGHQPFRRMQPMQVRRASVKIPQDAGHSIAGGTVATANGCGYANLQPTAPCACVAGYANTIQNQVMAVRSVTDNAPNLDAKDAGSVQGARRMSVIAATFNDGRRTSQYQPRQSPQTVPSACTASDFPSSPPAVGNMEPSQAKRPEAGDMVSQQSPVANGNSGVAPHLAAAAQTSVTASARGVHNQVMMMRSLAQPSGSQQFEEASSIQGARRMSVIQATFNDGRRISTSPPMGNSQQPLQVRRPSVISNTSQETDSADCNGQAVPQHVPANSSSASARHVGALQSQVVAMRNIVDNPSNKVYEKRRYSVIGATFNAARA